MSDNFLKDLFIDDVKGCINQTGKGGTKNYNDLENKPSINNVPLDGNLRTVDLKLADETLTEEGVPAEAKTVGVKLEEQSTSLVAGGKNLLNHNIKDSKIKNCSVLFKNDTFYVTNKGSFSNFILSVPTIVGKSYTVTIKDWSDYSYRCIASVSDLSDNTLVSMVILDATSSMTFTAVGTESLIYISPNNTQNEMFNTITFKCMLEEGSTATEYEPYFPSNKMLEEENTQQSTEMMDIKMLGWSVPRECPIQNEVNGNQFIQKVGRVDLGSLNWRYDTTTGHERFRTGDNDTPYIKPVQANNVLAKAYSNIYVVNSANGTYSHANDKSISIDASSIIWVYDTSYTDATTFKTTMQGQYLYYELATPITITIDGNEIGETVSDVRKETTVNLLKPTLQTTTINGVTCTANDDGTYTLNGTNSEDTNAEFILYGSSNLVELNKEFRLTGCPKNTYAYLFVGDWGIPWELYGKDTGNGINFKITTSSPDKRVAINVPKGVTVDNLVFKPMLTTNLNATYDDFVPYTGSTGQINSDVASLS